MKPIKRSAFLAGAAGGLLFLAACEPVMLSENRLSIEHPVNQIIIAEHRAGDYCGERGKTARLVQTSRAQGGFLAYRTAYSTFVCVAEKEAEPISAPPPARARLIEGEGPHTRQYLQPD